MRFHEISSGVRIPVSQEEQDIIDLFSEKRQLIRSSLDERQQEVARMMVSRGLLDRKKGKDGQMVFELNDTVDMWRF